eukprot:364384-Chlamydomonas_euryale.AAC.5
MHACKCASATPVHTYGRDRATIALYIQACSYICMPLFSHVCMLLCKHPPLHAHTDTPPALA